MNDLCIENISGSLQRTTNFVSTKIGFVISIVSLTSNVFPQNSTWIFLDVCDKQMQFIISLLRVWDEESNLADGGGGVASFAEVCGLGHGFSTVSCSSLSNIELLCPLHFH